MEQQLSRALIIKIQKLLSALGFPIGNSGPEHNGVDGIAGDKTKGAVKAFQIITQTPTNGEPSNLVLAELQTVYDSGKSIRDLVLDAGRQGVGFEITNTASKADFVNAVFYYAILDEAETKVPAAVTTAQGILESNYGQAVPIDIKTGQYSYNLFGIKGNGPAGFVSSWTREAEPKTGVWNSVLAKFRVYHSYQESIAEHGQFLLSNKRYEIAFQTKTPAEFAKAIAAAGYATDPNYARKLIAIMNQWGLK